MNRIDSVLANRFAFNTSVSVHNNAVVRGTYWSENTLHTEGGHELTVQAYRLGTIYIGSRLRLEHP